MNADVSRVSENDIHAYVDDQLDSSRIADVEAYLSANPDEARRVQQLRELNRMLVARHATAMSEPVPETLRMPTPTKRAPYALFGRVAAGISWLAVGSIVGWLAHSQPMLAPSVASTRLPMQAAVAHAVYTPEVLHPVEVTATQEDHLAAWLSKRLNDRIRVPHLSDAGYSLVGGRLLPGVDQAAAQFMYQNASGQRITLYVTHKDLSETNTAFQYASERGVSVFYWIDGALGYALSGSIDKASLLDVATAVYQQLSTAESGGT